MTTDDRLEALDICRREVQHFDSLNAGCRTDIHRAVLVALRARQIDALPCKGGEAETEGLHPETADLVERFARSLAQKLRKAEQKYGYSDGWRSPDWRDECQRHLAEHVAKGDPRDVAAYAAFCWHHGWPTATPKAGRMREALNDLHRQVFGSTAGDEPDVYRQDYDDLVDLCEKTRRALAALSDQPRKDGTQTRPAV